MKADLYREGERIRAIVRPGDIDGRYVRAENVGQVLNVRTHASRWTRVKQWFRRLLKRPEPDWKVLG